MKKLWLRIKNYFASVLKEEIDPFKYALSVTVSVFISCSPLFGLQTLLILFVSLVFKLNTPIAILASQISWPPTYAFIVYTEVKLGLQFRGETFYLPKTDWLSFAQNHIGAWFIGYLIFGTLFSLTSGILSYFFFRYLKLRRINKKLPTSLAG